MTFAQARQTAGQTAGHVFSMVKYVFVLLCGVVGLSVTPMATHESWQRYQAQHWPTTQATVSKVTAVYFDNGGGRLDLSYIYVVNGRQHVRHVEERASKKSGVRLVKERWDYFAIGKPIPIAYQPDQPEVSWMRNEIIASLWVAVALPAILLLGSAMVVGVAIAGLREPWQNKKPRAKPRPKKRAKTR
jgi:hypothetical protein